MLTHLPALLSPEPLIQEYSFSINLKPNKFMKKIVNWWKIPLQILPSKLLLIMKLSVFIICLSASGVLASNSYSQSTKLTLNMNNTSIKEVLLEIENSSEFFFLYNNNLIDVEKKVSLKTNQEKITIVLDKLFEGQEVIYSIMDRQIIISPKDINKSIRFSQPQIKGKVTDEFGEPLPGASIVIKGTAIGTVTDVNGNYALSAVSDDVLMFSFIGMITQEVLVGNQTSIDISMQADAIGLEEVVAVGYGTQKKINLTGAVNVVDGEVLANRSSANLGQVIQGTVPNLSVSYNSYGGEPGSSPNLNIRGIGSLTGNDAPYVLVDGVPMNMANVNPEDVESISVLKDAASAAIYGARGAYGVILISTKTGGKKQGLKVTYSNNLIFSSPTSLPQMTDGLEYATRINDVALTNGKGVYYTDETIEHIKNYMADPDNYPGVFPKETTPLEWGDGTNTNASTDWYDVMYKDVSFRQKHNLSMSGRANKTSYYFSAGYFDEPGLMNFGRDKYKRYNFTGNVNAEVNDWLNIGFKTKYTRSEKSYPNAWVTDRNLFEHMMSITLPTMPVYTPDGNLYPYQSPARHYESEGYNDTFSDDLWLSTKATVTPVKGWNINLEGGWNILSQQNINHLAPGKIALTDGTFASGGIDELFESFYANNYYTINLYTDYEYKINEHYIKVMLGYQEEKKNLRSIHGSKKGLITNEVPSFSTAVGDITLDDGISHWSNRGFFGRLNYSYAEKILLEANFRKDGSSRFEEGSRWGFFPSVSMGYIISKENFFNELFPVFNTFKLRASYGSLGNHNVANYLYLANLKINTELNYLLDGGRPTYVKAPNIVSSDLTWEESNTLDFGFDASLLNNRLSVSFDWYKRETTNMFGPAVSLPAVLGTSVPKANNASIETKGFEFSATWKQQLDNGFRYEVTALLSDNITEITEYYNETGILSNWSVGRRVGEIWGYTTAGVFGIDEDPSEWHDQSYFNSNWRAGDIKYQDLNDDGEINRGDYTMDDHGDLSVIGNSTPRYQYGLSLGASYKGFDFYMLMQGVAKRDVWVDGNIFWGLTGSQTQSSLFTSQLDYWTPENTDSYFPRPYFSSETNKNRQRQTKYLQNGAYLRMKRVELGYTVPRSIIGSTFIDNFRLFVAGENLLTITKMFETFDPEGTQGGYYGGSGKLYPLSKSISVGLNITF